MVFKLNGLGYVEVAELATYPESGVAEAIRLCPVGCIAWEGVPERQVRPVKVSRGPSSSERPRRPQRP